MSARDAEREAEQILKDHWDRDQIPVNPIDIAKRMGLRVYEAALPADVSGLLKRAPGQPAEIYLDSAEPLNRRRFTTAHELGHYVRRQGSPQLAFVDRRDSLSRSGKDPEERFANSFAAALLMPRRALFAMLDAGYGQSDIARVLGVSEESLGYRLGNLGLAARA